MKQIQKISSTVKHFFAVMTLAVLTTVAHAQDQGIDVDVDLDGNDPAWYSNPIVWVIGVAVFILLLVALMRSGNKDA
jgi:hypothetical protein